MPLFSFLKVLMLLSLNISDLFLYGMSFYKMVAKILANKMQIILPYIFHLCLSGFIK
ncbi:hypothetical protein MA16_Dca007661 [Dendrobium catenatum]|uniref:Uncharacterized protein n=1 Tax=Dendrobium catenatum TaxID=906689 RepID=A0A2I0X0W2_9ASPA|nr:hypothetical protein MA16_Dca007661 [Dendrobium catenatum]